MTADTWERPAAGAIAGERPAWATVWARWSEVSIHHVDLAIDYTPSHWSPEFVDRVIRRTVPRTKARLIADEDISITAPDLALSWESSPSPAIQVQGPSYAIVAWLIGRTGPWLELVSTTRAGVSASLPEVKPWA
jgi:maleylpyruvate isomerase